MKKLKIDDLIRIAFKIAEDSQRDLVDCFSEKDSQRRIEEDLLKQIHNYRMKKWGKGKLEKMMDKMKPVPITEIANRSDNSVFYSPKGTENGKPTT